MVSRRRISLPTAHTDRCTALCVVLRVASAPQCVACVPQGNGGESRKSFHGYPDGFAQLIDSPDTWHITPMQIDSRNRDCGVTPADIHNCSGKFTPGPEPKSARYGYGIPKEGTNYSGVIECPCTDNWAGSPEIYGAATVGRV